MDIVPAKPILLPVADPIAPVARPGLPVGPQPPLPAGLGPVPPRPVDRALDIDNTGFYESVAPQDGTNSALTMALNQSGRMIVGWFASPPGFVPNLADTVSRVGEENKFKLQGVLIANAEDRGPRGIPFNWIQAKPYEQFNGLDPDELMRRIAANPADATIRAGYLQFPPQSAGRPFQELLVQFDNGERSFDRFVRVKQTPRIPVFDVDFLPPTAGAWLIGEQIDPVPSSYMDTIRARVGEIGDPPRLPPTAQLLQDWVAGDKTIKKIKREQIAAEIDDSAFSSPNHAVAVGIRMRAHASASSITLNGIRQTYLEWYRDVLAEEEDVIAKTPGFFSIVKPKFARAGIEVAGQFAYSLDFGNKIGGGIPVVKFGIVGFSVDIKREKLEYARDASGQLLRGPDGKPVIKSRAVQYDTSKGGLGRYIGTFVDIGLGLGLSKTASGVSGGSSLGNVEFVSSVDLQPRDFDWARFTMTAIKAPGVSLGNFVSFDSFTSKCVDIVLVQKPATLSSITTTSLEFSPPKVPSAGDLKDPAKYLKKWSEAKLDGKIADVSEGWGVIKLVEFGTAPPRAKPDAPATPTEVELKRLVKREVQAFFAVDSAVVQPNARRQLEATLAIDRVLVDATNVTLVAWGYASPERDVAYNLKLSQARAEAVIQAMRDAYGGTLKITSVRAVGLGEEPSERIAQLRDPEASGLTIDEFIRKYPNEVAQWPEWRRVDLELSGQVIARMFAQP